MGHGFGVSFGVHRGPDASLPGDLRFAGGAVATYAGWSAVYRMGLGAAAGREVAGSALCRAAAARGRDRLAGAVGKAQIVHAGFGGWPLNRN